MRLAFLLIGAYLLLLMSCTKRPVTPTKDSRRAIDTIFQQKIIALKPEMDSACQHLYDSLYPIAVDSILQERRHEMEILVK